MKKVLLVCLAVLLLGAGSAFAEGLTVDVQGSFASEPIDELGSGFGGGLGLSYDLASVMPNLNARADFSYYAFSKDDFEMTRIPIFLGARYGMPVEPVRVYGDLGLEISMDKREITGDTATAFKALGATSDDLEDSETNMGIGVGAGVEYPINEAVSVGAIARYHAVDDGYFTVGITLGYKIPM